MKKNNSIQETHPVTSLLPVNKTGPVIMNPKCCKIIGNIYKTFMNADAYPEFDITYLYQMGVESTQFFKNTFMQQDCRRLSDKIFFQIFEAGRPKQFRGNNGFSMKYLLDGYVINIFFIIFF